MDIDLTFGTGLSLCEMKDRIGELQREKNIKSSNIEKLERYASQIISAENLKVSINELIASEQLRNDIAEQITANNRYDSAVSERVKLEKIKETLKVEVESLHEQNELLQAKLHHSGLDGDL